jgi:sodium-dependent dicarboxylate transporter 2/3/5
MTVGMPWSLAMCLMAWVLLTHRQFPLGREPLPGGKQGVLEKLKKLGPMCTAERRMLAVAVVTPLLWLFREPVAGWGWAPALGLADRVNNAMVALAMAVVCFLLPSGGTRKQPLLEWDWTARVPWGPPIPPFFHARLRHSGVWRYR